MCKYKHNDGIFQIIIYLKEIHFPSAPVLPSTGLSINAFWPSLIVISSTRTTGVANKDVSKKIYPPKTKQ